ncbi:MAG: 4a-hydroxytetrahydrobiopterin dehydratase [Gammaproteobacteria bacterium]|nr:4a-hydroxytetrahydrobiopterin dehydratase [Gammaproteobacteria bacterium]
MSKLTAHHCEPIRKGTRPLSAAVARSLMQKLHTDWEVDNEHTHIQRTFHFKSFHETIEFVNAVAWIANREDHHPDISTQFDRCTIRFSTHDINGLSLNDFICAAKVDVTASQHYGEAHGNLVLDTPDLSTSSFAQNAAATRQQSNTDNEDDQVTRATHPLFARPIYEDEPLPREKPRGGELWGAKPYTDLNSDFLNNISGAFTVNNNSRAHSTTKSHDSSPLLDPSLLDDITSNWAPAPIVTSSGYVQFENMDALRADRVDANERTLPKLDNTTSLELNWPFEDSNLITPPSTYINPPPYFGEVAESITLEAAAPYQESETYALPTDLHNSVVEAEELETEEIEIAPPPLAIEEPTAKTIPHTIIMPAVDTAMTAETTVTLPAAELMSVSAKPVEDITRAILAPDEDNKPLTAAAPKIIPDKLLHAIDELSKAAESIARIEKKSPSINNKPTIAAPTKAAVTAKPVAPIKHAEPIIQASAFPDLSSAINAKNNMANLVSNVTSLHKKLLTSETNLLEQTRNNTENKNASSNIVGRINNNRWEDQQSLIPRHQSPANEPTHPTAKVTAPQDVLENTLDNTAEDSKAEPTLVMAPVILDAQTPKKPSPATTNAVDDFIKTLVIPPNESREASLASPPAPTPAPLPITPAAKTKKNTPAAAPVVVPAAPSEIEPIMETDDNDETLNNDDTLNEELNDELDALLNRTMILSAADLMPVSTAPAESENPGLMDTLIIPPEERIAILKAEFNTPIRTLVDDASVNADPEIEADDTLVMLVNDFRDSSRNPSSH